MTNFAKYVLFALAVLASSITVPAADLPTLPVDKRIIRGTLGCGATYYMVTNPTEKGYADIAVIRREEAPSQDAVATLKADFFSRMAIAPRQEGYLSDNDGSSVFRYEKVATGNTEVLDSTLLYTFGQMALSRSEQAIIVCGDIDPVELKKKMDIFSMLVPRILVKEAHAPDYVWEPSPAPYVVVDTVPGKDDVEISVTYSSARIPQALMNTPQTLATNILAREYQTILGHRLERNLRDAGIPYGEIKFSSLRSWESGGDERYGVAVTTSEEFMDAAMRTMSSTIGELDSFGASLTEFSDAKRILRPFYLRGAARMPSNAEDVDRCIAHFLYGAPLSSFTEESNLFARRNVPDSVQRRHFNLFASALAEQLTNLSLKYIMGADSLDKDEALFYYNLAYLYGSIASSGKDYSWHSGDSLGMERIVPKSRIKSEKLEPVTGGKLWTFSNGMRVAYKQIPGSGMFSWSLVLNGGLSSIQDLLPGEGGYIGDMFYLYDAGGLSCHAFQDIMASSGLSMVPDVGVFCMSLSGDAPSGKLAFLLKCLGALANDRNFNWGAFEAYSHSRKLSSIPTEESLSLIMDAGFPYESAKRAGVLTPETARKADKYYQIRFARMNDGILLLSGDLEEGVVKKLLQMHLGGFDTDRGTLYRPQVDFRPTVGTRTMEGRGPKGLYILMDTEYSVTAQSYYMGDIAAEALRSSLVRHLAPYGYYVDVQASLMVLPQERFRFYISCLPASPEGLPEGTVQDPERAITAVRAAVREVSSKAVSAADLKTWKASFMDNTRAFMASPEGAVNAMEARYAFGKDISKYQDSINSITPENIKSLLKALASGGRIEFIADEQ
ncbi:MAG: insulinase family protein [Bacteroidales bacterium]|nr:insulinase family protein [Bacteroidales bacterium]